MQIFEQKRSRFIKSLKKVPYYFNGGTFLENHKELWRGCGEPDAILETSGGKRVCCRAEDVKLLESKYDYFKKIYVKIPEPKYYRGGSGN